MAPKKIKDRSGRLPFGKFLAWKSSDIASAACFMIVNGYLTLYCTNYLGVEAATVGTILLISNIFDAVTDLISCYIVDNTKSKLGKARPYELGILGVWICTILMFNTPTSWSHTLKVIWIFFMYTFAFGVFNTFRGAAMQPYLIRAFGGDRTVIGKVGSFGGFVTTLGAMVVSLTFPIAMGKIATSAEGWGKLVLLYGIPMLLLGLPRFIFVKEDKAIDAADQHDRVTLKIIFKTIFKNKYIWLYAGIMLMFNAITSIGVTSYYFTYIVGNTDLLGIFSMFSMVLLPLMFFMPLVLKKFSAPQIVAGTAILALAGYVVNYFAGASIPLLFLGGALTALTNLPISYLGGLMLLDVCTYNEYNEMPRLDSSTTIVSNFASQIGQGIGGALLGWTLAASGFVSSTEGAVAQPESAINMIRYLFSFIPLVLMVILAIFAFGLAKLPKKMPEYEAAIAARRAEATPAAEEEETVAVAE